MGSEGMKNELIHFEDEGHLDRLQQDLLQLIIEVVVQQKHAANVSNDDIQGKLGEQD